MSPPSLEGMVRRSITLEAALDREAHACMGEEGFSAFVAEAVRHHVNREKMRRFLDVLDNECGPPSTAASEEAEKAWLRLHGSS